MVALNRKKLLHAANYFGRRGVKGSNRKMIAIDGMGLTPFGSGAGITTFGGGLGYGIELLSAGSLLSKIKKLASPILKKGSKAILETAKQTAAKQVGKIADPKLRALAESGLRTGEELVSSALKGNTDLSKMQNILKSNLDENKTLLKGVALEQGLKGASKLLKGKGYGYGGKALPDTVAGVTDRKLKSETLNRATDNRQLTILKDIIRSKPINTRVNKGMGLSTF